MPPTTSTARPSQSSPNTSSTQSDLTQPFLPTPRTTASQPPSSPSIRSLASPPFHRREIDSHSSGSASIRGAKGEFVSRQILKMHSTAREAFRTANTTVLLYLCLLLVSSIGNSIFFKKMTNALPNYPYFLSQLTTLVYVPVFFTVVAYERYLSPQSIRSMYTPEVLSFSKVKFLIMGAFDSLAGVLALFAGVHTSGSTQAILSNSVIPLTMVLSILILNERYKWTQYVGASIILTGVTIVILPNAIKQHEATGDAAAQNTDLPLFNLLFLISAVPSALSGVYKELAFKNSNIDIPINYLQAYVALFQLIIGLFLIPINTLSFLGDQRIAWDQLPETLWNGSKCLVGINSVVSNCGVGPDELQCDQCDGAWIPVFLYMVFNLVYNVAIVLVIKHATTALMYVVLTLKLPLVQLAFTLPFIVSPPDSPSPYTAVGLICIVLGLILYRWTTTAPPTHEPVPTDELDIEEGDVHAIPHISATGAFDGSAVKHKHNSPHSKLYDASPVQNQYTPPTVNHLQRLVNSDSVDSLYAANSKPGSPHPKHTAKAAATR